jgi:hypothetical protein
MKKIKRPPPVGQNGHDGQFSSACLKWMNCVKHFDCHLEGGGELVGTIFPYNVRLKL